MLVPHLPPRSKDHPSFPEGGELVTIDLQLSTIGVGLCSARPNLGAASCCLRRLTGPRLKSTLVLFLLYDIYLYRTHVKLKKFCYNLSSMFADAYSVLGIPNNVFGRVDLFLNLFLNSEIFFFLIVSVYICVK